MASQMRDPVLNAIADDYESIETILEAVRKFDDPMATADQVTDALSDLIKDGLAQAYDLSPWPPHVKMVDFELSRALELWFYVTSKGKDLVRLQNANS